mmetsp:Transcript_34868/g.61954  ORF Transcript_34868/g.61954 Transcript_34868/m.61954 type:complete len:112 (+) Transcript_34868:423-758(+)
MFKKIERDTKYNASSRRLGQPEASDEAEERCAQEFGMTLIVFSSVLPTPDCPNSTCGRQHHHIGEQQSHAQTPAPSTNKFNSEISTLGQKGSFVKELPASMPSDILASPVS